MLAHGAELGAPPEVVLSGARWRALLDPERPDVVAPGPRVASRSVALREQAEGVALTVRWRLDADEPGWLRAPLVGSDLVVTSLSWKGREVGLGADEGGMRSVALWVDGPGELVLDGYREARVAPGEGPRLPLLPAPHGTATLPEDWVFAADGMVPVAPGRWWGGDGDLAVTGRRPVTTARGAVVGATVATGVTVDEGAARVEARLHVTALRGSLDQVVFSVPGAGPDLAVEGPAVASFDRAGDRVTVALRTAGARTVALDVRWSVGLPDSAVASVAAPRLIPEGVSRAAYVTKLARAGDVEVVPDGSAWRAMALAELPDWAEGLVSGTATAAMAWSGGGSPAGLQLQLLRFEPVPGPATLIDVAQTAVALSDEGRMLMRTHLQVRNDRGAYLRVTPPPGTRIVGVSVAGEVPEPLVDGDAWRLPLKKSVETVDGLLSFPVRVVMVGDAPVFDGRTKDTLPLPTFDADIAVHRVSVNLPMGHSSKLDADEQHVVESFTEGSGITYGFAVGDARATEADALFQSAVSQWMSNDFDAAQSTLDTLKGMGAGNDDIDRLQGNLDLLFADDATESASARRVKEQAKYRSVEETRQQAVLLEEAEQALLQGDYDRAESNYAQALDIGDKLAKLDAGEDMSNAFKNVEVQKKLEATSSLSKQKKKAEEDATKVARDAQEAQARQEEEAVAMEAARQRAEEMAREEAMARAEAAAAERQRYEEERRKNEEEARKAAESRYALEAAEKAAAESEASVAMVDEDDREVARNAGVLGAMGQGVGGGGSKASTTIDFEDIEVTGELVRPDGAYAFTPVAPPPPTVVAAPPANDPSPRPRRRPQPEPAPSYDGDDELVVVFGRDAPLGDPSPEPMAAPAQVTTGKPVVVMEAKEIAVEVIDTSRSTVLEQDFLNRVPAGRSYQSAVQATAGLDDTSGEEENPNMGGGSSNENAYLLDGLDADGFIVEGVPGGVEGGVVGGVVGSVLGGSFAGAAADEAWPEEPEVEEEEYDEPVPVGRELSATVAMESRSRGPRLPKLPNVSLGGRKGSKAGTTTSDTSGFVEISLDEEEEYLEDWGGGEQLVVDRKKAVSTRRSDRNLPAEPVVHEPADTIEIAMGDDDEPPDVKATSLDVIVPAQGETVRYQHLLVPAGEAVRVPIHTRPQRSRRNR